MNVNYPIVVGDSSWFEKRYGGTIFLPTTLFLDREGKVIAREIGVQSHNVYVEHIKKSLDADPVVREQRRLEQQKLKGITSQSVTTEIRERDLRDRTRAASPLVPAADALILDSTALSEDEVLRRVEEAVQKKTDALR
jgi:cytidylate kinase